MKTIAHLITRVQSLGLRIRKQLLSRKGGAGPAEGGALIIGGYPVMAPVAGWFVEESPFELRDHQGQPHIFHHDEPVVPARPVERPRFYDNATADGVPYPRIALLHGIDCLATTVLQTCRHWRTGKQCGFCGIELSLNNGQTVARKSPEALAEVAGAARNLDGITHLVLTTGDAAVPGNEIDHLAQCTRAVKAATDLPVHVQFSPPDSLGHMEMLKEAGVDSVGIHMESFDPGVLAELAPAKAEMGAGRFDRAWRAAVEIFGANQVSSFILTGLGESRDSVVEGCDYLTDLGVLPFVVPLRPIPGTALENRRPPDPEAMIELYEAVTPFLSRKGLASNRNLAGCSRCGACSAMMAYEDPVPELVCHPARTREEIEEALAIRRQVFVSEQNVFAESDEDDNDLKSIHLVARYNDRLVGTVRVFPLNDEGHWEGGRLAVLRDYRAVGAGERLVREAVACVKKQRCTYFTAHIQEKNVPFFKKLGWRPIGDMEIYFQRPHQMMVANLDAD